jgi:hypothetical protein
MSKVFDWSHCNHSPQMAAFLKSVQNSGISEAEFVERYRQIVYGGSKGHSIARSRSTARSQYRHLAKNFDFFAHRVSA